MPTSSPPLPRVAVAACLGLTAVAFEAVRRHNRGPIRRTPPIPVEIPHQVHFGLGHCDVDTVPDADLMDPPVSRDDPFFWMRDDDRKDPAVLQHLREENAYSNFKTLPLRPLSKTLYQDLLSHYVETDSSVPAPRGKFSYYTKTVAGKSYRYYCRRPVLSDGSLGDEDVLLDINALAASHKHCDVLSCEVSPDDKLLAYSIDTSGYETYQIRFMCLDTRTLVDASAIHASTGTFEWGLDSNTIFYHTFDEAHRPDKLWRRDWPSSQSPADAKPAFSDVCLCTEPDTEYALYSRKSRSCRVLIISSVSSMTAEHRFIDMQSNNSDVRLVRKRSPGVLYDVSHGKGDNLYIVTNLDGDTNFKVMTATMDKPAEWMPFLPYQADRKIDYISSFDQFCIVVGREGGYKQLWIMPEHDVSKMYRVPTEDEAHSIDADANLQFETKVFRYGYSSLTTPRRVLEIDVETRKNELLKQYDVPAYDQSKYGTERLEAVSKDGTKVPISLVYKKDSGLEGGPRRVLLYGYGSYEMSMDPSFSMSRLPLLDRGVVYAIAHVRGGGEFGRGWYEAARMEEKMKTFEDFIAAAQLMVDSGRTKPQWMAMEGRSAGGLLVGAVANMRPDLFGAVVAGVPFVDVVNTMSDASIPLTTGEWQEWGNPHTRKYFDAISAYCPYTNVGKKAYPAMLVLAGLYDPRVMYSEPTKWVAKLRKMNTGDKDILLKVDMSSGHFSASNRYHYLKEKSFEMAWMLRELNAEAVV